MDKQHENGVDLTPKYVAGMSSFLYFIVVAGAGAIGVALANHLQSGVGIYISVAACNALIIPFFLNLIKRGGLKKIRCRMCVDDVKVVVIGITILFLFDSAFAGLMDILSVDAGDLKFWNRVQEDTNIAIGLVASGIIGPIVEELYFRGIIYGAVRHYKGYIMAVVVSSTLFAVGHGTLVYMIVAFVSGLILATVYELTRNLFVPIILHCANNILACLETEKADEYLYLRVITDSGVKIAVIAVVFMVVLITMFIFIKKAYIQSGDTWAVESSHEHE